MIRRKKIKLDPTAVYYDIRDANVDCYDVINTKSESWGSLTWEIGNIFKACWRWGLKSGDLEYDARKIVAYAIALLDRVVGTEKCIDYVHSIIYEDLPLQGPVENPIVVEPDIKYKTVIVPRTTPYTPDVQFLGVPPGTITTSYNVDYEEH